MRIISREMRGIPFFLLQEYLVELGGTQGRDDLITGQGWKIKLTRMEPDRLHALSVGQTRLDMELEDEIADQFLERFAIKTLRAGA